MGRKFVYSILDPPLKIRKLYLLRSREDIHFRISSGSVGERNIEFDRVFKKVEKCLLEAGIVFLVSSAIDEK